MNPDFIFCFSFNFQLKHRNKALESVILKTV